MSVLNVNMIIKLPGWITQCCLPGHVHLNICIWTDVDKTSLGNLTWNIFKQSVTVASVTCTTL